MTSDDNGWGPRRYGKGYGPKRGGIWWVLGICLFAIIVLLVVFLVVHGLG